MTTGDFGLPDFDELTHGRLLPKSSQRHGAYYIARCPKRLRSAAACQRPRVNPHPRREPRTDNPHPEPDRTPRNTHPPRKRSPPKTTADRKSTRLNSSHANIS